MLNTFEVEKAAQRRVKLAAEYSQLSDEMGKLEQLEAMQFVQADREKLKTDKSVQKAWDASEEGQRLIYLKRHVKGVEKELSALSTLINVANHQSMGHY